MLPLRYARHWRLAGVVLLFVVLTLAMAPAAWFLPDSKRLGSWLLDADKWFHLLTFAFLAIWFAGQYRPRAYWQIGIGLIVFGLMIEACQRLVDYRTADWIDVAADAAGITIGLVIATAGVGGWSLRVEDRYRRRTVRID